MKRVKQGHNYLMILIVVAAIAIIFLIMLPSIISPTNAQVDKGTVLLVYHPPAYYYDDCMATAAKSNYDGRTKEEWIPICIDEAGGWDPRKE